MKEDMKEEIPTIGMLNKAFEELAISNHSGEEEKELEEMEGRVQQILISEAAKVVKEYVKERFPSGAIGVGLSREIVASIGRKWNELAGE